MIPVETNALEALINADVDKAVQTKVLRLVVAHGNAVSNHKGCLDKIKKLNAEVKRLTSTNAQLIAQKVESQQKKVDLDKKRVALYPIDADILNFR